MAQLTADQERFLVRHNIPLSAVFDATGIWLPRARSKAIMRSLGKWIAFGTSPCGKAGHTLRTRGGACIQCKTATIAFQRRYLEAGYVYVAGSLRRQIVKVGQTSDPHNRCYHLNIDENYAGTSDWKLLYFVAVPSSGKIEFEAHKLLDHYAAPLTYEFRGVEIDTRESFYCGLGTAVKAIESVLGPIYDQWKTTSKRYEFPEKTGHSFYRSGYSGSGSSRKSYRGDDPKYNSPQKPRIGSDPPAKILARQNDKQEMSNGQTGDTTMIIQNDDIRLQRKVTELDFRVRTNNCLKNEGVIYVGELVQLSEADLLRTANFGRKQLNEVKEKLFNIGLHLNLSLPNWLPALSEKGANKEVPVTGFQDTEKDRMAWYDCNSELAESLFSNEKPSQQKESNELKISEDIEEFVSNLLGVLEEVDCQQAVMRIVKTENDKFMLSGSVLKKKVESKSEVVNEEEPDLNNLSDMLGLILKTLSPDEERAIRLMYDIGEKRTELKGPQHWTHATVGAKMNISHQAVGWLIKKAFRKLKNPSRARKIRKYIDQIEAKYLGQEVKPLEKITREELLALSIFGIL